MLDRFFGGRTIAGAVARLPIRAVKLDRSIVASIDAPPGAGSPAEGAIETARRLGLEVGATGVETRAQLDFLRRHGCTRVQGFLFSEPLPLDKLVTLLREPEPPWAELLRALAPRAV